MRLALFDGDNDGRLALIGNRLCVLDGYTRIGHDQHTAAQIEEFGGTGECATRNGNIIGLMGQSDSQCHNAPHSLV